MWSVLIQSICPYPGYCGLTGFCWLTGYCGGGIIGCCCGKAPVGFPCGVCMVCSWAGRLVLTVMFWDLSNFGVVVSSDSSLAFGVSLVPWPGLLPSSSSPSLIIIGCCWSCPITVEIGSVSILFIVEFVLPI